MKILNLFFYLFVLTASSVFGQVKLSGTITHKGKPVEFVKIGIPSIQKTTESNPKGEFSFSNLKKGKVQLVFSSIEHKTQRKTIQISSDTSIFIELEPVLEQEIEEIVVSGTMKEVSKTESTVNVEVFSPAFFKKNPTPSLYEAVQSINGVRPQLNCNICNTGDIHINGLEGPYTMVLIDGMPIVSSLASVYGLSGIPNSLVERMEVVKGPASTLYGSEAIGGIINVITKNPQGAPLVSADIMTNSWLETNADLGFKFGIGKKGNRKVNVLTGINYFKYGLKQDKNNDGFTDITLQDRISVFQKWNFRRKKGRIFSLAGRYVYEDRWGGEMNWTPEFRGGDSIYGESIYTSRWEILGKYQLPFKERVFISTSVNQHKQNSFYGTTSFMANQFIAFGQIHWDKRIGKHDLMVGTSIRYSNYDDDTPATVDTLGNNRPSKTILPGIFAQNEIHFNKQHKLLLGLRYDYNNLHGSIFTPRVGYKWSSKNNHILRINAGTGYRVVNIFTEDHAALTGAREVVLANNIKPEQSYNANINYYKNFITEKNHSIRVDATAFFTYFTNRIVPNYEKNANEIHYENLDGYAVSQGASLNLTLKVIKNMKIQVGGTYQDVALIENGKKQQQILTEKISANWSVSYTIPKVGLTFDFTGKLYGPMRLPVLNELDPRPEMSPTWAIQNIQIRFHKWKRWEIYGGVKNFLNWTPNKGTPFMIARPNDPFDKNVQFDSNGEAVATAQNPYGLTFDPAYVYAPNQGARAFLGVRFTLK